MKKIFIVTSGEYSDYHICAVFTDKQLAEKYISAFNVGNYDKMIIEEWGINPHDKSIRDGLKAYRVRMDKDGNVVEMEWADSNFGFGEGMANGVSFTYDKELMNSYCFARDENHAIKIANERRGQIIANNTWGKE